MKNHLVIWENANDGTLAPQCYVKEPVLFRMGAFLPTIVHGKIIPYLNIDNYRIMVIKDDVQLILNPGTNGQHIGTWRVATEQQEQRMRGLYIDYLKYGDLRGTDWPIQFHSPIGPYMKVWDKLGRPIVR
jgi:hypothetical protein